MKRQMILSLIILFVSVLTSAAQTKPPVTDIRKVDFLNLTYTSTLLAGGVLAETARARAASLLDPDQPRQPGPPLRGYLDLAERLGVLPEEVQSQLRAQARDLAEATDRFGRTVDLAMRLAIYLAIAVFVIAMYLPIFTIGSTV